MSNDSHRQDLLAGSSQQDCTGFGVFALGDKGEILIADFLHLKQTCSCSHIFLTQLICPAGNACSTGSERQSEIIELCHTFITKFLHRNKQQGKICSPFISSLTWQCGCCPFYGRDGLR